MELVAYKIDKHNHVCYAKDILLQELGTHAFPFIWR